MGTEHVCTKVTLRQRPISNGRITLYLDYYPAIRNPHTMKMTRREFLGIYISANPKSQAVRDFNNEMLEKAEAIRCQRQMSLINDEFGFLDHYKMKADALSYFKEYSMKKGDKYLFVYAHFDNYVNHKCSFGDLTVELCNGFRDYLTQVRQLRHKDKVMSRNSAAAYWRNFRAMLKKAYLEKYLKENLNDYLEAIDIGASHSGCLWVMMLSTNTCEKRGAAMSRHIVTKRTPIVHKTNGPAGASNLSIGFCLFIKW